MNSPAILSVTGPILVLGLGDSGWATVRWLRALERSVRVADTRKAPPWGESLAREHPEVPAAFGPLTEAVFDGISVCIISPGVSLQEPVVHAARQRGVVFIGDVELFCRTVEAWAVPPRLLAVTGANGKSTVSTLLGAMGQAAGYSTAVIGNIGTPVLAALLDQSPCQAYVLELSSFQLETLEQLNADVVTLLNISEDHLDRYPGMADYGAAKARIFSHARHAVVNRDDARVMAVAPADATRFGLNPPTRPGDWGVDDLGAGEMILKGHEPVLALADIPLVGRHNVANVMTAMAMADRAGWNRAGVVSAVRGFRGLPHRVERVRKVGGVWYIDDSKGTNVGATVAAIEGIDAPLVLIAGGDGKGQDFSPLGPALRERARLVIQIGRDGPRIETVLRETAVPVRRAESLPQAVELAAATAQAGDVVLMSPACASFDMFDNYLHRAEVFRAAVERLADAGAAR